MNPIDNALPSYKKKAIILFNNCRQGAIFLGNWSLGYRRVILLYPRMENEMSEQARIESEHYDMLVIAPIPNKESKHRPLFPITCMQMQRPFLIQDITHSGVLVCPS